MTDKLSPETKLEQLHLSLRARKLVHRIFFPRLVSDISLATLSEEKAKPLLVLPNVGPTTLKELREALAKADLHFADEAPDTPRGRQLLRLRASVPAGAQPGDRKLCLLETADGNLVVDLLGRDSQVAGKIVLSPEGTGWAVTISNHFSDVILTQRLKPTP